MTYLDVNCNKFADRCGFSQGKTIDKYLNKQNMPDLRSIAKITARYPVNEEWLCYNKGQMWRSGKDYFLERFQNYQLPVNTPKEKVEAIKYIFECDISQMSRRTKISRTILYKFLTGALESISPKHILKFRMAYDFIPYEWYLTR